MTLTTNTIKMIEKTTQIIDKRAFKMKTIMCLLLICITGFSFSQPPKVKAFPTAEGFGKYATGGRGGAVIKVTNLNDSGPGSLRQALQYTSGPRTVIFEVGGTIALKNVLPIKSGNVTIAGQTAPGGGILIKDGHLLVESSNVIIRHMRFRYGTKPSPWDDSLSITAWGNDIVENIVIDHCSISWGKDENFEVRVVSNGTARNITLQNSIVSEGGKSLLLYGPRVYNISLFENLIANNRERNIRSNYPSDGKFDFEMVNNIVYGFSWGTTPSMGSKFAVINNIYKESREVEIKGAAVDAVLSGGIRDSYTDAYISGNSVSSGIKPYHSRFEPYLKNAPFSSSGIMARDANQIEDILPHVGASLPKRDAVDERMIQQYKKGDGTLNYIGRYPKIENGKAQVDTDNDGMPDEWEIENGLDPNDALDRNFVQPDGYTNLEYYLNGMTLKNSTITASAGQDIDICEGSTTTLTATGGTTYLWNTGATTSSIKVSPESTTTYTVSAYDKTGKNFDTAQVMVKVNRLPKVDAGEDVTINAGESITLKANGATSYVWSTGDTDASISVSPVVSTTYTLTGSSNGCEVSDTVKVIISNNTSKGKVSAGESQSICKYSSTALTATGGVNYLWSTGQKTATIYVGPHETTDYSVTAYDESGKEIGSDKTRVVVNDGPKISAGNNVGINVGESTTLTATGASTYLWSNGATTASITVSPEVTTYYYVTGTTAEGCGATTSVLVMLKDTMSNNTSKGKVSAGESQSICKYSSTALTATGGVNYLWNTGQRTATIYVGPNETTDYSVTAYDEIGNEIGSDETRVVVNDGPKVSAGNNVGINVGESTTLTATGASTYLWSNGATTASITVSPDKTTYYYVTGTTAEGCGATTRVLVMLKDTIYYVDIDNGIVTYTQPMSRATSSVKASETTLLNESDSLTVKALDSSKTQANKYEQDTLGTSSRKIISNHDAKVLEDDLEFEFLVHPNPTDGEIHIKILGLNDQASLHLYDLSGKSLYNETINADNQQSFIETLDLSDYESGIYILRLVNNNSVLTKKVVLK